MRLVAKEVSYSYRPGGRPVLDKLSLEFDAGSYWCLAGPNGSGKSTFLKLACGLLPLEGLKGELSWNDRTIDEWGRLELARNIGFVAGALKTQFPVPVRDYVLQGRYSRSPSFWAHPTATDAKIADEALERVGVAALAQANIGEISAGELQLTMIARALAQEPNVLVLDEATANLDLRYQLRVFSLLEQLHKEGMMILVVSHDLNLAAEFCPNATWMRSGSLYSRGALGETLTRELMDDLYEVGGRVEIGTNPHTHKPKIFWK